MNVRLYNNNFLMVKLQNNDLNYISTVNILLPTSPVIIIIVQMFQLKPKYWK